MFTKKLSECVAGEEGVIIEVLLPIEVRQRVMEMGFVKGTRVKFIRRAPLGDPIEVRLMNHHLMIRCTEAQYIFVLFEN